jgi:hypothetical protein
MRIRVLSVLLLIAAGTTFSLIRGQERPASSPVPDAPPREPAPTSVPEVAPRTTANPSALTKGPARDFSKLSEFSKEMLTSCQRGAEWLARNNDTKGHFVPGYLPALNKPMEGDSYLRQAGAAYALARAARFLGNDLYAARATQTILKLLDETVVDADKNNTRHTSLPSTVLNRLGASALLVLAIHELPSPQPDLVDQAEQMCNWIRKQVRADGSLRCRDDEDAAADDPDNVNEYPGLALYAVLRSQSRKPAEWKTELARKAVGYYRDWWKAHRSMAFVPWQTAAFSEAYVQTKDKAFAEFVFDMNDWLCGLQYDSFDSQRLLWFGGFMKWADGKAVDAMPTILSSEYVASLAEARRAARTAADADRYQRYNDVLQHGLQFLVRLQYTNANTQHFEEWYRPRLVGGFHASLQDGDLRIEYAQHTLSALVTYLEDTGP